MPPYSEELDLARSAARAAARLCIAVQREMLGAPEQMEKAGREPVTIADYGAQALILREIRARFPSDGAFAEERAADFASVASQTQRDAVLRHVGAVAGQAVIPKDIQTWLDFGRGQARDRMWAVDPIDGTKGFLRNEQFAIAIALTVKGELTVAALACPMLPFDPPDAGAAPGVIAWAVRGLGGMLENLSGDASRPLRVSSVDNPAAARVVESVESGHTDHSFSADVLSAAGVGGGAVRMDSQAKYVAVADGRAEIYIRHSQGSDYKEKVWDHAAGALMVTEAGGRVTDLGGRPLDFSAGERLGNNHGILGTNGPLHDRLLEAIRAQG
jgi:3'(2'), 5'-bisphosphate nucleotidase